MSLGDDVVLTAHCADVDVKLSQVGVRTEKLLGARNVSASDGAVSVVGLSFFFSLCRPGGVGGWVGGGGWGGWVRGV